MTLTVSAWRDDDFEGVANLFIDLWGWELEGTPDEIRDISELYVGGAILACDRLRVIRQAGRPAAFLGSVLGDGARAGESLADRAAFAAAALQLEERVRATPDGLESIVFNDGINAANRVLKEKLAHAHIGWDAELKLLMTSSAFQGRGFAKLLVRDTLDVMKARGAKSVILFTDTHCNWRYYEKSGWSRAAEHDWVYKGETITALAYRKML